MVPRGKTKADIKYINTHALHLIAFYKRYKDLAGSNMWAYRESKQAFHDALESMKRTHLIQDYDLHLCTITTIYDKILFIENK